MQSHYQTGMLGADQQGTAWERNEERKAAGSTLSHGRKRPDPEKLPPSTLDGALVDESKIPAR